MATFWLADGGANLRAATPYTVRSEVRVEHPAAEIVRDGTAGVVAGAGPLNPIEGKAPTTVGKVFFIGSDLQPHWCAATSVQSLYRNVVATAGHCVMDVEAPMGALDKWAFVPGHTEGAAPFGLYVGKQAAVSDHFENYRTYDHDFGFANVYDGVTLGQDGALAGSGRLGDNVGGQGFAWNRVVGSRRDLFGYPSGGDSLATSSGATFAVSRPGRPEERLIGVASPFANSLGAMWLATYSTRSRLGYLDGITVSVADTDGDGVFDTSVSSYFDSVAAGVYSAARHTSTGPIA
ncbi:hypothetical protein ACIBH1_38165 [Nonomuraea sp. NPDC050663]|uniref:hypothetical protein n=1 Tax=Nonomuraea sp. NPDC050663 TaxID=3364370 RepID=UPI0037B9E6C0